MLSSITLGLVQPQGQSAIARLFANNEPGFDYDATDFNRTTTWRRNLLTWSEQFDNATWLKVAIGTGSAPVVTPNAAVAPDGTTTAALIAFNRGAGNAVADQSYIIQTITPPSVAAPYTFSIWLKAATGGDVGKQLALRTVGGSPYGVITLTANWVRYTRTETGSSNNGAEINTRGTVTADNAVSAHVWGAQTEPGSVATDYQRMTDFTSDFRAAFPDALFYADTAGTTPVTAVEQTVALILDKSRGLVLGPELVTNGTFDANVTGWTKGDANSTSTWVAGQLVSNSGATTNVHVSQSFTTVAGRSYLFTADLVALNQNSSLRAGTTAGGNQIGDAGFSSTLGARRFVFTASGATTHVSIVGGAANATATIDNISVRELPGLHQQQATAGSRAVLRSRYNLATFSEQFDNAAWTKANVTVTADTTTAPDGTLTADKLIENTTPSVGHQAYQTYTVLASTAYTVSLFVKPAGRNWVAFDLVHPGVSNNVTYFDVASGVVGNSAAGNAATITAVGNGWYRCAATRTTAAAQSQLAFAVYTAEANGSLAYTGDGTSGLFVWGADLRAGNDTVYPYQLIRAATDYAVGPQFPTYLEYDGVDDSYASAANLDLSGTDKVTVFAAITKLSDAARGNIVELTTDAGAVAGGFIMRAPQSATAQGDFGFFARGAGTLAGAATAASFAAPRTVVLAATDDIAADSVILRVNGVQAMSDTVTDQGTGNFANAQVFLGGRSGGTLPFRGRMYRVIGRGAATATPLITAVEQQLNGQIGRVY